MFLPQKEKSIPSAIDCHCHITHEAFEKDREQILNECAKRSILVVNSALTPKELELSLSLYERGLILQSAGWDAKNLDYNKALEMRRAIENNAEKLVAVGEVGLDWFWVRDHEQRRTQEKIFRLFIDLADALGKPLVVHSRSAGWACGELLLSLGFTRVLMHAFDGSSGVAKTLCEKGMLFSIPPSIARSEQKLKLVKNLPLSSLCLESDAPVLAPTKGERNTPLNVFVSASWIAQIKRTSLQAVLQQTTNNALTLFKNA
ncbi:hypothetical protein B9Q13_02435 [Candidatus Marsarchaeota G2 archaeon ECH_B_SAG-G16]|uniref:Uncharacterized protein n=1 Tax=Candidatus Marsarchaeota G2 archaeon ECH_B_SAG-G16 TaxID=1978167 RepID=A0A2R6C2Y4_9ARCH|nr:MAG: hypothetical protein B9Q13_02435 [Candidatus Marsarchaeota G2 archaeon ECH_B_SAG-G16]